MDKLKMHSMDMVQAHIEQIGALFPNCVTETMKDGKLVRAIDFDMLRQELSDVIVEGPAERYQFTWPEKRKSILTANAPISDTLRPVRTDSVDFDQTENIYIEGDNLAVLKLLQETYLGKIRVIYIDPPYNTGKDFIYNDDFSESTETYLAHSGQYDELGNRMVQNSESNGRFHTNWLNMMYPRLRLAKDLLTQDGIILISIDEKESGNMRQICDEIFGAKNYFGDLVWEATTQPTNAGAAKFGVQKKTEVILMYGRDKAAIAGFSLDRIDGALSYPHKGKYGACRFEIIEKSDSGDYSRPSMKFQILGQYPREGKRWQIGEATARELERTGKVEIVDGVVKKAVYPEDEMDKVQYKPFWSLLTAPDVGTAQTGKDELNTLMGAALGFDTVKPVALMKKLLKYMGDDYIVLDFFSGTATTAHATMALNAEDGGHRRFIMVQIPEKTDESGDAARAGYRTICEIGKERIRRASKKIKEDSPLTTTDLDTGFRVLKLDSSNMEDVYYRPDEITMQSLFSMADNIKADRTPEDLLFQVMLDLGILLSSKIEETTIAGKKVFSVADGYLYACFDSDVSEETVKAIAQKKPYYAVFRDSGFATDSVATNFEQIFETYSPSTTRKVL